MLFILGCSSVPKVATSTSVSRGPASFGGPSTLEGLWQIQGENSLHGSYEGVLEVRASSLGLQVVRIITYRLKKFEGLQVQELWTGQGQIQGTSVVIHYSLKQGDFITRWKDQKRHDKDFESALSLTGTVDLVQPLSHTEFGGEKAGIYRETYSSRSDVGLQPLWQDERRKIPARGRYLPNVPQFVFDFALKTAKNKIGYDTDPRVNSYANQMDFKTTTPYLIFDPTDFEFYRANPEIVRLVNKVTDGISLIESAVKRNAYAYSLKTKQKIIDQETAQNHINSAGMLSPAILDESGHFLRHEREGDSSLWTGMYVASQAMRYAVTKDSEALQNLKLSLKGLMTLIDVTGDRKEFARTVDIWPEDQPVPDGWQRGSGNLKHLMWLPYGNNDMVKGVLHGAIWAAKVVPRSETEIWDLLRQKSKQIMELRIINEKPQNKAAAVGLAAFVHGEKALKNEYLDVLGGFKLQVRNFFDGGFYYDGSADWSGVNLSMVGDINDILVADLLEEKVIARKMKEALTNTWSTYEPVRRHFLTVATYAFAVREGLAGNVFQERTSKAKFLNALDQAKWGLRELPVRRPSYDIHLDHSKKTDWVMSPVPRLFWKTFKKQQQSIEGFYQGLYGYPAFEMQAFFSSFSWKDSAFGFQTYCPPQFEQPSADYLYMYWMGRYAGLFQNEAE